MTDVKLIIVRGHSGSGKSTKAKELAEIMGNAVVVEADQFFENPESGQYLFDRNLLKQAHAWCQSNTARNLHFGKSVIVANTFCRQYEAQFYIDLAKDMNIPLEIIECTGDYQNIHGVPPEIVQAQKDRFEQIVV